MFFLYDRGRFVVCNVNPGTEHTSPWVLNLRANSVATLQVGPDVRSCRAREVYDAELEDYWPRLIALWPAYREHYKRSGERTVFVLEPRHERCE